MATTTRILDANVNGTVYTANANSALEALDTCHSGATAPTDEVANGKLWLDTSTTPGILKIYNNAAWEVVQHGADVTVTGAFTSLGIDDNAAATAMTLDASGNVGIGTSSPSALLDVVSVSNPSMKVRSSGGTIGNYAELTLQSFNTISGSGQAFVRGVSSASGNSNTDLVFGTNDSGFGAPAERMRIDASGNVGIGTAAPSSALEVNTSDFVQMALRRGTTGAATGVIAFQQGDGTAVGQVGGVDLGGLQFRTGAGSGTERMRIDSSGNVLVGTVSEPTGAANGASLTNAGELKTSRATTSNVFQARFFNPNGLVGSITSSGSATAFNVSSDYRLKENITPVQGAADIVKAMQPVTYNFKADSTDWHDGFLAHELQELHPRAVIGEKDAMRDEEYEVTPAVYEDVIIPAVDAVVDEDGNVTQEAQPERTEQRLVSEAVMGTRSVPDYQGVDYSKLTPILTAALQEALNKIDALEARVAALEP